VPGRARIESALEVMLADDRRSWQLGPDGMYRRTEEINGRPGSLDTFETLKEQTTEMAAVAVAAPHRPHAGMGSLDPRA
jgi:polyphosphate kinase